MSTKEITLNPGESREAIFTFTPTEAKIHTVNINGLTGSFEALAVEVAPKLEVIDYAWADPQPYEPSSRHPLSVTIINVPTQEYTYELSLYVEQSGTITDSVTLPSGATTVWETMVTMPSRGGHYRVELYADCGEYRYYLLLGFVEVSYPPTPPEEYPKEMLVKDYTDGYSRVTVNDIYEETIMKSYGRAQGCGYFFIITSHLTGVPEVLSPQAILDLYRRYPDASEWHYVL